MDIGGLWLLGVVGGLTWWFWAVFEENNLGSRYVFDLLGLSGLRFRRGHLMMTVISEVWDAEPDSAKVTATE
jgi:hypothetical protein